MWCAVSNPNVVHVAGAVDPVADIEVTRPGCALADLGTVEKAVQRYTRPPNRAMSKEATAMLKVLETVQAGLLEGKPVRILDLTDEQRALLKPLCLITAKPAMFVGNVAEDG